MRIELDIDRLTINGIPLDGRQLADLRATLIAELTRLLSQQRDQPVAARALTAPQIQLGATPTGTDLGRQLARSVHRGLADGRQPTRNRRM